MAPDTYEFRLAGRLSDALLRTFDPVTVRTRATETVFERVVGDDAELYGVIARIEGLGMKLIGVQRVASSDASAQPGD